MRTNNKSVFSAVAIITLSMTSLFGCGQRISGNYNLTQSGGQFNSPQCSQINLAVNESSNQVYGTGANSCYTETIQGTSNSNGQMMVTLSLIPTNGAAGSPYGFSQSNSMACTYQGTLTVSGSAVSGMLSPVSSYGYGCSGSISITGTRN